MPLLLCALLNACSELPLTKKETATDAIGEPVPAAELPPPPYVVRSGDSISTIGAALGLDYLELAELNGLEPPYTIYEGQVLSTNLKLLTAEQRARVAQTRRELIRAIREGEGATGGEPPPVLDTPVASDAAVDADALPAPMEAVPTGDPAAVAVAPPALDERWAWPASGEVLAEFSVTENKGLDIAVAPGEPVRAAADGVVQQVYTNVPRYGGLIVVKHDERRLGFYGYLRRMLVSEGEKVSMGQPIAEVSDDGSAGKLHFELRIDANPVNPREVFPPR